LEVAFEDIEDKRVHKAEEEKRRRQASLFPWPETPDPGVLDPDGGSRTTIRDPSVALKQPIATKKRGLAGSAAPKRKATRKRAKKRAT
jgi:hypothetical protein